jgi:dienelactone hydrolase
MTDAKAFIARLDGQSSVSKTRKIGTQGYCMGGPATARFRRSELQISITEFRLLN